MWSGTLHDKEFTTRLLTHIEKRGANYGTFSRMKGMITLAVEVRFQIWNPPQIERYVTGNRHTVLFYSIEGSRLLPLHLPIP